jgi:hypothetical protein
VASEPTSVASTRVGGDTGGDAAVELDDVGGGHHDVPQRGEAGADVVDGQPQPGGAERGQGGGAGTS